MLNIVVCVSGGGTNLQAIIDGVKSGTIRNTRIVGVISNNAGAYALTRAKENEIPAFCISPKDYADREAFNQAFLDKLAELAPDLIVLAGFPVISLGMPIITLSTCSRTRYWDRKSMSWAVGIVVSPLAMICAGSVTAIPVRRVP